MKADTNQEQFEKDIQLVLDGKAELEKLTSLLRASHESPLSLSFYSLLDKAIQGFAGDYEDVVKMFVFDDGLHEDGCMVGHKKSEPVYVKTAAELAEFIKTNSN